MAKPYYRQSRGYVRLRLRHSEFTSLFKYIHKKIGFGLQRMFRGYIIILRCDGTVKVPTVTM